MLRRCTKYLNQGWSGQGLDFSIVELQQPRQHNKTRDKNHFYQSSRVVSCLSVIDGIAGAGHRRQEGGSVCMYVLALY